MSLEGKPFNVNLIMKCGRCLLKGHPQYKFNYFNGELIRGLLK